MGVFLSGHYAAVAVKKDAFWICIWLFSARDPLLNIGPLGAGLGCPPAAPLPAAAPGLPHPPPPPAPHHCIQRAAPGLPAALRLGRGAGGAGRGGALAPSSPHPRFSRLEGVGSGVPGRMNGPRLAGGAHCSGPGMGVAVRIGPPAPADPAGRPPMAVHSSSLPGGAARAWAGKEGAGEGWSGGRKARGGGR